MGQRTGQRCGREGCRAWALRGGETCRAHTPRVATAAAESEEAEAFWQRVATGEYRDLIDADLARIIMEAGQDGSLIQEIGALRVVMTRLLEDKKIAPQRLAESIPRIVGATVRALKAQCAIGGETAGDLTEALTRVLIEMGLGE